MSDEQKTGHYYTDSKSGLLTLETYTLLVTSGPDKGVERLLGGTLLLGTHPSNDLVLSDETVSRYHLEIQVRRHGLFVKDQDTTNGTRYRGARVGSIEITERMQLQLGKHTTIDLIPAANPVALDPFPYEKFGDAIGKSVALKELFALLSRVAQSDATLLLGGETGTGKEVLAEAVHKESHRSKGPFIVVDCASIPSELIASELFGHAKGSFTGASRDKIGLLEAASGGTLFLDEIGELNLHLQPQLLRVLENREIRRIGETRSRPLDCRIIAATHRDLFAMASRGLFREDLYFRLAVVEARVPALRDRAEDIGLLAQHFAADLGHPAYAFSDSMLQRLQSHHWPGNVRELRNLVERTLSLGSVATRALLPPTPEPRSENNSSQFEGEALSDLPFKEAKGKLVLAFERDYIEQLLVKHGGNISQAANEAGIDRNYIHRLIKKHKIEVSRK